MKSIRTLPKRLFALLAAMVLLFGIVIPVILPKSADAAQLQSRQLKISSSANGTVTTNISGVAAAPGSGGNGQKTREDFSFKIATSGNVGSVLIQFCDDPIKDDPCVMTNIAGFSAANVSSIVGQTNWGGGAFSLDTSTVLTGAPWSCAGSSPGRTNCIAINRGSPGAETASTAVTLAFGGGATDYITNPTTDNKPFFARIYTFSDTAYTAANIVDYGTVVGSTAQQIDITSKVKEVLNFSVSPIATQAPGSTCTPLTDNAGPTPAPGSLLLGDTNGVLSFTQAYDAHSYFRLSTNTNFGVSVYYSGDTLKNGSNAIAAVGTTAAVSAPNTPQFGLGIDNSDTQGGNGYSFSSLAAITNATSPNGTDYSNAAGSIAASPVAKFGFNTSSVTTPEIIATTLNPVACDTGSIRYLGNISTATPAGIYTTTITYIATGKY
ncbi:MAG: hypothetical protein JWO96_726 [Candidatus Saccharibacteria bacterium]|nr:hypothetical protein [Candidatus Saccharibacteria bacterium]